MKYTTDLGSVEVIDEVLAKVAGAAALECYGLVGMASRNPLRDGVAEVLRRDNLHRGITIRQSDTQGLIVDMYVIVGYGVNIPQVASMIQSRVRYAVENNVGIRAYQVNIFIQGVR